MQIKTIERTVRKKMEEWLESITDLDLRAETKKNLLVSGGCLASMLLSEDVNDFDVYIQDQDTLLKLCKYYTKDFSIDVWDGRKKEEIRKELEARGIAEEGVGRESSAIRNLTEDRIFLNIKDQNGTGGLTVNQDIPDADRNYIPLHFSPNAISLSNDLQIVVRFWGSAEEVHKNYDFVHATQYYTTKDGFVRNQKALESLITKTLYYQGSKYPITSIIRAKKFIKRGFKISAGEYLKMAMQVSDLDLSNIDVLEDQLVSIDALYFSIIIGALRDKKEKDPDFKVSTAYISELVDRIFNEDHEYAE